MIKLIINWFISLYNSFVMANSSDLATIEQAEAAVEEIVQQENLEEEGNINKKYYIGIGLNVVDKEKYRGWDGRLYGPLTDIKNMGKYCIDKGYEVKALYNNRATVQNVLEELYLYTQKLVAGDTLIIHYSGHGSQILDLDDKSEKDGKSETWCCYDGELIDNWLSNIFNLFKPGVKIVHLSDSCHSGSMYRNAISAKDADLLNEMKNRGYLMKFKEGLDYTEAKISKIPKEVLLRSNEEMNFKCSYIGVGGCQDHQTSLDLGHEGGLFTLKLLKVLTENNNYTPKDIHEQLCMNMPKEQQPSLNLYGSDTYHNQPLI